MGALFEFRQQQQPIQPSDLISVPFQARASLVQVCARREEGARPSRDPRGLISARLPQELQLLHGGQPGSGQYGRHGHRREQQACGGGFDGGSKPLQDHGTEYGRGGSDQGKN